MMKIPSDETPESHRNGDGYISDEYEQLEMMPAPIRDNDFSEYMWMENEEEFNSQVLRELEEEELMEECLAAMLNDGPSDTPESSAGSQANGSRTSNDSFNSSINGLSESVDILSLSSNGVRNSSDNHSQNTPDSSHYRAQSRLERLRTPASEFSSNHSNSSAIENGSKSTLNPDAQEFVPLPRRVTSSDNIVPS